MKALFSGNLMKGMKLVGVYTDAESERIARYLGANSATGDMLDCVNLEYRQFVELAVPSAATIYGDIARNACVILVSGSLTRGISAVGPYPDRNTAFNNAVALTFGSKSANFYPVEIEAEYEEFRAVLAAVIA
ncbi:hypothetical protein MTYP_01600 [Methylophilaceae bacterium]|nr:hypothetical protein MTYP_01600 [Methylophilaceae bacterium]